MTVKTAPIGYEKDDDGALVENEGEQAMLVEIYKLADLGLSLRGIARQLHRAGYRTRRGGTIIHQYVKLYTMSDAYKALVQSESKKTREQKLADSRRYVLEHIGE